MDSQHDEAADGPETASQEPGDPTTPEEGHEGSSGERKVPWRRPPGTPPISDYRSRAANAADPREMLSCRLRSSTFTMLRELAAHRGIKIAYCVAKLIEEAYKREIDRKHKVIGT